MTHVFAGGLSRPKGYGLSARGSNDKPEMGPSVRWFPWRSGDRSHDWKITWLHKCKLVNDGDLFQGLLYPKFLGMADVFRYVFDTCC